jgi:23S rRNA (uridine2552-2'-O)-methyltransferase
MSKRWIQEHHRDAHYRQAKREGYRARSAYKLLQINERFEIIRPHDDVIDLGCAPGGWLQVIKQITDGKVIGIDIKRIAPIKDVIFIRGDMTSDKVHEILQAEVGGEVNTVVSDMSPNISGHYSLDQANSVYLAEMALKTAELLLGLGGNFVVKVFEGDMYPSFIKQVKGKFSRVKIHNPKASRKSSSEVYVIAKNYYPRKRERDNRGKLADNERCNEDEKEEEGKEEGGEGNTSSSDRGEEEGGT